MVRKDENPILTMVSRIVSPLIMLFALYVIFHGHYSPGGGFQGGTMLAAAVLLVRLAVGSDLGQLQFKKSWGTILGAIGVLIYFGTGFLAMLLGGNYLNYEYLPLPFPANETRAWGILSIEIGVGLAVMGILVAIYDDLLEARPTDGFYNHPSVFGGKKPMQDFLPMVEGFSGNFLEARPTDGFYCHPSFFGGKKPMQDFLPMVEGFSGNFLEGETKTYD